MSDLTDEELLRSAMISLDDACGYFMSMKNKMGDTLFHMTHSIMFYVEEDLVKAQTYGLAIAKEKN